MIKPKVSWTVLRHGFEKNDWMTNTPAYPTNAKFTTEKVL